MDRIGEAMPKKERPGVHVGDIWVDRDKRMLSGNRRVRVVSVTRESSGTVDVRYQQIIGVGEYIKAFDPVYRSRYERFQRAFDLEVGGKDVRL
jgi:hypothetical protein